MDRESAVASGGSYISLNENEKRYYSGLHNMCQDDSSGKLSSSKVAELFKTSQLAPESLHQCGVRKFGVGFVSLPSGMAGGHSIGVIDMQALEHCYALIQDACRITEVCGAKRLGYFDTLQLYVALKLLAAAQSGLPIRLESITSNLPLPMFVGLSVEPELHYSTFSQGMETQGLQCGSALVPVPWTPVDRSAFRHQDGSVEKKEPWSPDRSPCCSPPRSPSAFHNYPYAMQKNGTDSQMGSSCDMLRHIEPRSAVFSTEAVCSPPHPETIQSKYSARAVVQMEKHASPSIYRPKAGLEHPAVPQAPSVERLDQRGVADYSEDDPWRITAEQREYYTVQFTTLQPDLGALILGAVAKNFFTKSKLPIPELSHIWELSDVDRDGALTFSEFCTAFHLIVARKNGYTLPEALPATLQPGFTEQEDIPDTPDSVEPLIVFDDAEPKLSHLERTTVERLKPVLATPKQEMKEDSCKQVFSSKSGQDKYTQQVVLLPCRPDDLDPQMKTKTRPRSYSSASIDDAMKKREDPPTPPPRPQKTHSRASSLDLNKLFQQGALGIKGGRLPPPPALPPRPSVTQVPHFISSAENTPQKTVRQPNFADFSRFREEEETVVNTKEQSPLHRGVPSTEDLTKTVKQDITRVSQHHAPQKPVRRKYQPDSQNLDSTPTHATSLTPAHKPAQKLLSRQRKEIQMAIRKNKETNAVLTRLNSELQQQLKEVHQERVTLESQLELLRPLASA